MKKIRIILCVFLGIVLLTVGFFVWFCTGSFMFQISMSEKFVIDAPISVVCKRAMNIKSKPKAEKKAEPKIDMQEAAKNYSLGKPIELELEHPKLGKIRAEVKINLEAEPNSLKIRGRVVSLNPSLIKKFGKPIADVENIALSLKVAATDESGSDGGFMQLLSKSGKTVIELEVDSKVCVHFREMGILNTLLQGKVEKAQHKIHQQIKDFVDENLNKPTEEELAEQKAKEAKAAQKEAKKKNSFWNLLKKEESKTHETEEKAVEEEEKEIDVSALDEEI